VARAAAVLVAAQAGAQEAKVDSQRLEGTPVGKVLVGWEAGKPVSGAFEAVVHRN